MQSQVREATLNVFLVDHDTDNSTLDATGITIQVSRVTRSGQAWGSSVVAQAAVVLTGAQRREGSWVRLNVTAALAGWLALPRAGLGLVVRAQDERHRRLAVPDTHSENDNNLPFLEVYVEDTSRRRTKRNNGGLICSEESEESRCCRYPLTVDFEEFGWDWIIAPKRYEANFCMGDCPFAFMQKYPNTHVVHLAAPPGYVGPCCTPRKMSPISLLHFDHELNIILGSLPAMVVERCGCT